MPIVLIGGLTASANAPIVMHSMRHPAFMWVVLGVITLALVTAVSLPYRHYDEETALSDSDTAYRVCQLSDGLSAAPPRRSVLPMVSVMMRWQLPQTPRLALTCVVGRVVAPRAPPSDAIASVHV